MTLEELHSLGGKFSLLAKGTLDWESVFEGSVERQVYQVVRKEVFCVSASKRPALSLFEQRKTHTASVHNFVSMDSRNNQIFRIKLEWKRTVGSRQARQTIALFLLFVIKLYCLFRLNSGKQRISNYYEEEFTMKKRMAITALGLGAAYLMRNKDSRDKLSRQFNEFNDTPMRGDRSHTNSQPRERKKGLLGNLLS